MSNSWIPACCLSAVLLAATALAQAPETAYVTRDFKAGLHDDKSADSPISALVPAGTALEIVKRDASLSYVRAPDGTAGWIDNSYLSADAPSDPGALRQEQERNAEIEARLTDARDQIRDLEARLGAGAGKDELQRYQALKKQNADLEQKLKAERLRAGDLQVQVAELRKRIGVDGQNSSLLEQVQQLEAENKKLQVALGASPDAGNRNGDGAAAANPAIGRLASLFAMVLIAGFAAGVYLMDYLSRRRHGGFRV